MEFVSNSSVILGMLLVIFLFKLLIPKDSYGLKLSLIIAVIGATYFALKFINSIEDDNINLWPAIFFILCCIYIYKGGRTVAYMTITGVFSRITRAPISTMSAGSMNWLDPIFEYTSISSDGVSNKSVDLQELKIKIAETSLIQTSTRGIQAKVKNISFMVKINGNIKELLRIEGGAGTVRGRIVEFAEEFFLEKIPHLSPSDLDQDKRNTIHLLTKDLKTEVNKFCRENNYPYEITSTVLIKDTELEPGYYELLAKKVFAELEQNAQDVDADRLRLRLLNLGNSLLPGYPENEKIRAAMVALKIIPKSIEEKTYGVSPEILILMKELADIFKK